MKKTILCLAIVSILVLSLAIFAGCNENSDECVVTFITENGGKEVRYEKTVKAGALVTLQDFTSLQNGDSSVGHSVYTGFSAILTVYLSLTTKNLSVTIRLCTSSNPQKERPS